jgi:hypothetical protein
VDRIRLYLRGALLALGPLGIAGVGLLVFAAAAFLGWVLPTRLETSAMQQQLATRGPESAETQQAPAASQDPLADFYEFFPSADTSAQWLAKVYAVAEKERLDLPRGEYRLASPAGEPIATYEAVFALRGRYSQLRAFIAGILEEIPIVALDDVRLERQRTADSMVDARLRLTFFLRNR